MRTSRKNIFSNATDEGIVLSPNLCTFFIENLGMFAIMVMLVILSGYERKDVGLASLILAVVMTLVLLYRWWYLTTVRWTITERQIKIEQGIFIRDIGYIELYRVVDYAEKQNFLQIIFGLKDVIVLSGDRTTPALRIYGIPVGLEVIPIIKLYVEEQKKEHHIYEITNR